MKRYVWLLLGTALAGLLMLRMGGARGPAASEDPGPPSPGLDTTLALRITTEGIAPPSSQVPLGARVHLEIAASDRETLRVSLGGYEDRVALTIAPGAIGRVTFDADRPGEDFPWRVSGQPAGVLSVTGAHLVEGHR